MKFSKAYTLTLIFCSIGIFTYGQSVNIKGRVLDQGNGDPLEFANIALLDPADSTVMTGGMTGLDGSFEFEAEAGSYILRVGFIGYDSHFENIDLGSRPNRNFGSIKLTSNATNLEEVTVQGVASMFETDIDKRRYNVENSIVAEGATASELLSTLPSIQVDEQGSISMRGSGNVLIYINGRPSNLSGDDAEAILSQFPASSIQTVELITNPSSRYDAAGVGGIINIVLKKNQDLGFNGQANVAVGTRDKYTGGLNLNYGTGKFNIYTSYNYQNRRRFRKSDQNRITALQNASPILNQDSYHEEVDISHLLRGGIDYNISENSVLGVYAQGNMGNEDAFEILNQRSLASSNQLDSLYVRNITEIEESNNFETGINYTLDLDTAGQRLYTSFSYAYDERNSTEDYLQQFFNNRNEENPGKGLAQTNDRRGNSTLYIFQADYQKPFNNGGTLESGIKGTFGTWERGQEFSQGDLASSFLPVRNDTISDAFNFREDVYAAYLIYKGTVNKIGYQAGVRGEYTETLSTQARNNNQVVNNYFNFFPSLYLSYSVDQEEEITANYSRRISRPNMWGLSPLYRVDDLLNVSIGNPYLQPEFTDSYELGYMKGWTRLLLNATVYHRYSTSVATRITRLTNDNVTIQTRENADTRSSTGFELINQLQFTDWFDATLTGNFFYSKVGGENIEEGFSNSNFSWTISALSNMAVPNFLTFQLQGNYRGPIVMPQGELLPYWTVNLGAKKEILDNRATISLNVSDIFNTGIFKIRTEDTRFSQDRVFNRETRIGTLSFTYRFGGFQERRNGGERDRDFDEDDDF